MTRLFSVMKVYFFLLYLGRDIFLFLLFLSGRSSYFLSLLRCHVLECFRENEVASRNAPF